MTPKLVPTPPAALPDDPIALRARLARRDPSDWPRILDELRQIVAGLAPAFRDVCSADDALGELALRTHERWLEDWLAQDGAPPLRLFLRDRLRDHLRELKRTRARRAELLRGALPTGGMVESEAGAHEALFASAPPQPDESLEARELHRDVARASGVPSQILDLRAAGFDQAEIAAHTGMSRPTVGRRLAAAAAVIAVLAAAGVVVAMVLLERRAERSPSIARVVEPVAAPVPPSAAGSLGPAMPPAVVVPPPVEPTPPPVEVPPGQDPTSAPASLPELAPSASSAEDEARVCLANADNACVIRVLGNGRAVTARQLAMLAQAQRAFTGPPSACPTVRRLLTEFPSSVEANRYRMFDAAVCVAR